MMRDGYRRSLSSGYSIPAEVEEVSALGGTRTPNLLIRRYRFVDPLHPLAAFQQVRRLPESCFRPSRLLRHPGGRQIGRQLVTF